MNRSRSNNRLDPFSDRTARNIRNSLSKAFVDALGNSEDSNYKKIADQWLSRELPDAHRNYVLIRIKQYDSVFEQIGQQRIVDPLKQTCVIWNKELFFEVHELLESTWHQATGDFREALKGLIKASGVYIHLEQGHRLAAQGLSIKAASLLKRYGHALKGIRNLDAVVAGLQLLNPVPSKLESAD